MDTEATYLPEEYILGLKAAMDEKQRLLESLPKVIEALSKRFDAAMLFAPPGFDPNKSLVETRGPQPSRDRPASAKIGLKPLVVVRKPAKIAELKPLGWRRAILHVLTKERGGLPHRTIVARVREEFPHLPPSEGDKSYYSAVGKLMDSGTVVKHGNVIYTQEAMEEAKAKGTLPPISEVGRRSGSSAELILELLRGYPAGLTANDMRARLARIPGAPKSLYEHGQYIYGILGPMLGTQEVLKDGELYRLGSGGGKK